MKQKKKKNKAAPGVEGMQSATHPSYARASVRHYVSSHDLPMFGSSLTHNRYVVIEIHQAKLEGGTLLDEDSLIRVRMTHTQFIELVASGSHGFGGVPCTLESTAGKRVEPPPPPDNEITKVVAEYEKSAKSAATQLDGVMQTLTRLTAPGEKVSKVELSTLLGDTRRAQAELASCSPYLASRFAETLEKMASAMRTETPGGGCR